jgi:hypothetical protein
VTNSVKFYFILITYYTCFFNEIFVLCSDVDTAITTFRRLQKCDPFRLDNLDTYSNLLYVRELRVELAHLAHQACEIDKYRVETCCVVGELTL